MLRTPPGSFVRAPRSTRSRMSQYAVSVGHLASFAYLDVISLPSQSASILPGNRPGSRETRVSGARPVLNCFDWREQPMSNKQRVTFAGAEAILCVVGLERTGKAAGARQLPVARASERK